MSLVLASSLLIACTPSYDWREIQPAEEPFVFMLPGKPVAMTRKINLDGLPVDMRMHGAQVNQLSFTAAWTTLDESATELNDRPAIRAQALSAMQAGMTRNIAGSVVSSEEQLLPIIDSTGTPIGQVPGVKVHIRGTARGEPADMIAVFVGFGATLYQFVVLGADPPAEHVETFLGSLRLRAGKPSAVALTS
ncbi:MAG: hypothetical protein WA888_04380 [Burkholderiaceae bacterium]